MNKRTKFVCSGNILCKCKHSVKTLYTNGYDLLPADCVYSVKFLHLTNNEKINEDYKYKKQRSKLYIDFVFEDINEVLPALSSVIGAYNILNKKQFLSEKENILLKNINLLLFDKSTKKISYNNLKAVNYFVSDLISQKELAKETEIGKENFKKFLKVFKEAKNKVLKTKEKVLHTLNFSNVKNHSKTEIKENTVEE